MDKIVADQRARGGPKGKPVLIVLVAALILLGIYMVVMLGWSGSQTTNPNASPGQQTTSQPNVNQVPAGNPAYPSTTSPNTGTQGSAPANR